MAHIDSVIDKIIVARVGLLLRHPFFGNMATRLKIQDASDWCKTAATDGRSIFFNREFFEPLSVKQIEFVIAHEILHNVFDHMTRVEGRNKRIWNIAADYCVNGQLVRDRIGEQPPEIKIFHDAKYYGKGAEEVYDEIYNKHDEEELEALGQLLDTVSPSWCWCVCVCVSVRRIFFRVRANPCCPPFPSTSRVGVRDHVDEDVGDGQ